MYDYKELLKSAGWQERRLQILNRDNFTCQSAHCKNKKGDKTIELQVHHIDYWAGKKPWEYPDEMLITLCKDCHKLENVRNFSEGGLLTCLKQIGLLCGDLMALQAMFYTDKEFKNSVISKIRRIQNG